MPDTRTPESEDLLRRAAEARERQPRLTDGPNAAGIAADHLRQLIERIERLEEEKAALGADIREVYAEAKGAGFDTKILRQVIRLRKLETADRQQQETLLDLYKTALGMP